MYELPQGYTQDADTDIQVHRADEVVPVVLKLSLLSDVKAATPLVGAVIINAADLYCFDPNYGYHTIENLMAHPTKAGVYIPESTAWADVLHQPLGALAPIIKDSYPSTMATTTYAFTADGVTFTGSTLGDTISFFVRAAIGTKDTFALAGDTFYRGANATFNRLLVSKDAAEYAITTQPSDGVGYITVTGVATSLKASYAVTTTLARQFISPNPNWVGGHIGQWPDVFQGLYDYPGDNYVDTGGTPVDPGTMPLFVDPGLYSVNFRDGTVTFPSAIDSTATPVRANYAYLSDVANVTNQKLTVIAGTGNLQYKADTELLFTDSHGKRWVNRNDVYTPLNVYVDGVLTPQPTSVLPYDTLDVKMS